MNYVSRFYVFLRFYASCLAKGDYQTILRSGLGAAGGFKAYL